MHGYVPVMYSRVDDQEEHQAAIGSNYMYSTIELDHITAQDTELQCFLKSLTDLKLRSEIFYG